MIEINLLPHRRAKRVADLRESVGLLVLGLVLLVGGISFFDARIEQRIERKQSSVRQLQVSIERFIEPMPPSSTDTCRSFQFFRYSLRLRPAKASSHEGHPNKRRPPLRTFRHPAKGSAPGRPKGIKGKSGVVAEAGTLLNERGPDRRGAGGGKG